ncbi:acyl-CoA dehydrogenase NM domain-like protein [Neolentinus lepideus HHB14362 ss-1]|uniref:Acyl-CoA dehydrogenase NM domain-like protein n=1 Tax=Neolentinus lepideus HHB14362 ss-1 TaxID=1314782 RepID=A0A165QD36_9AGAM|nr:acyl-CoA dehydrogenase NM domain-like protein [Neolentinus lepideus HHB14362 ss-1]
MQKTSELARSPLFQVQSHRLPWSDRVKLSYDRARAVVSVYNLSADDVLNVSSKYWEFHSDPILSMDGAMATLLTIHFNLCTGTLAMFSKGRKDLVPIIEDLLSYRLSGQFCLTELGHGLDVINMETTATQLSTGEFELETPVERAAKFMPPTSPCGIPCVAVVFARLLVNGEDRGPRPFLVYLHDGKSMNAGITVRRLTPRGGACPVEHCITYFHRVHLPRSALLGDADQSNDVRKSFFTNISRVISGTLSMGAWALIDMKVATFIAGRYSIRRTVIDASTKLPRPIASFSTQYIPILTAVSQTAVMQAFAEDSHSRFVNESDATMKHFIAAVFKTTMMRHSREILVGLADRCGAQGLFEVNQISVLMMDIRGAAIAEGDTLGISIRFAVELLLDRIILPTSTNPESLLARHEQSLLLHLKSMLQDSGGHRDAAIEYKLLPQCRSVIESVGYRLAYDAAVARGVDRLLIDLYVASVMSDDAAWYAEHGKISGFDQKTLLVDAARVLVPRMDDLLSDMNLESYVTAPIVSDERWSSFTDSLHRYGGPEDTFHFAEKDSFSNNHAHLVPSRL